MKHERAIEWIDFGQFTRKVVINGYIFAAVQSGNAKPKQIPITFDTQAIAALQLKLFKLWVRKSSSNSSFYITVRRQFFQHSLWSINPLWL